jgi:hypothetical protein
VILARDGERDTIDCGTQVDTVVADRFDRVAASCEHVQRLGQARISATGTALVTMPVWP